MKKLISFSLVIGVLAFSISGCSKGSAGPAGPAGPAGASGTDSIIYSSWITLNTPLNTTDSLYEEAITANALTSAAISSGVVESYVGFENGGDTAVFNIYDPQLQSISGLFSQILFVGEIDIAATGDYTSDLYRYIIVPGSILTTSTFKQYTKEQIKTMSYSTVTKLLKEATAKTSSN
jgi:hypothetical protein